MYSQSHLPPALLIHRRGAASPLWLVDPSESEVVRNPSLNGLVAEGACRSSPAFLRFRYRRQHTPSERAQRWFKRH